VLSLSSYHDVCDLLFQEAERKPAGFIQQYRYNRVIYSVMPVAAGFMRKTDAPPHT